MIHAVIYPVPPANAAMPLFTVQVYTVFRKKHPLMFSIIITPTFLGGFL